MLSLALELKNKRDGKRLFAFTDMEIIKVYYDTWNDSEGRLIVGEINVELRETCYTFEGSFYMNASNLLGWLSHTR